MAPLPAACLCIVPTQRIQENCTAVRHVIVVICGDMYDSPTAVNLFLLGGGEKKARKTKGSKAAEKLKRKKDCTRRKPHDRMLEAGCPDSAGLWHVDPPNT